MKEVRLRRDLLTGAYETWGTGAERGEKVGNADPDLVIELINAMQGPLWCLRVSDKHGLLLKTSGANYQRVGIFVANDMGRDWFHDSELRTLTLV